MNKITSKIHTYYDIMSPPRSPQTSVFDFPKEPEDSPISSESHHRLYIPETFLYSKNSSKSQNSSQNPNKNLQIFTEKDLRKTINKQILKKPLLCCLEGFNAGLIVIEPLNIEKSPFITSYFSLLFSCLNYLKKVCQDFKRDSIATSFKLSFLMKKDPYCLDLLAEKGNILDNIHEVFFLDIDELIKYLNNVVINNPKISEFEEKDAFLIKIEVFFNAFEDQLCWKGRLIFAGFFGTQNQLEISEYLTELLSKITEKSNKSLNNNDFAMKFLDYFSYNTGISLYFEGENLDFLLEKSEKYEGLNLELQRNRLNDISDYLKTIEVLQKSITMKEYEISSMKLECFLKDKENDELKIKEAQLESNVAFLEEQNGSVFNIKKEAIEEGFDSKVSIEISLQTEGNPQTFLKKEEKSTNVSLCKQNNNNFKKNSRVLLKSETEAQIQSPFLNKINHEFVKIEGVIEINYYEELTLLREKFHKLNKENIKLKADYEKLKEVLEEKSQNYEKKAKELEEIREKEGVSMLEIERLNEDNKRLKGKNEELQKELIDLYEVYAKKEFGKKK